MQTQFLSVQKLLWGSWILCATPDPWLCDPSSHFPNHSLKAAPSQLSAAKQGQTLWLSGSAGGPWVGQDN